MIYDWSDMIKYSIVHLKKTHSISKVLNRAPYRNYIGLAIGPFVGIAYCLLPIVPYWTHVEDEVEPESPAAESSLNIAAPPASNPETEAASLRCIYPLEGTTDRAI